MPDDAIARLVADAIKNCGHFVTLGTLCAPCADKLARAVAALYEEGLADLQRALKQEHDLAKAETSRAAAVARQRDREWYEALGYEWGDDGRGLPTRADVAGRQRAFVAAYDTWQVAPVHAAIIREPLYRAMLKAREALP